MMDLSLLFPLLQITSYSSTYAEMFPIIAIAVSIDAAIVALWYFAGAVLNNNKIKSTAMGEFYQVFGTALLVVVLAGILVIFANAFYSATSSTSLMSPSAIFDMCKGINSTSMLTILDSSLSPTGSSLLYSSSASGFPGLCALVNPSNAQTFTEKADYPLAAAGVIIANVTNQTATGLNSFFVFDAYMGFLEKLSPSFNICISPGVVISVECLLPIPGMVDLMIHYAITPFAGYSLIYKSLAALGDLLTAALESFTAQLTLLSIFLYTWPYFLFVGIILRAIPFTRKIGGLLLAIAVAGVIFFPLIFSIEYLSLAQGLGSAMGYVPPSSSFGIITPGSYSANDIGSYYGFGNIFTNSTYFIPNSTGEPYVTNFYVMPDISAIAVYGGCWPNNGNLFETEQADTQDLLIPYANGGVIFHSIIAFADHNPTPPTGTLGITYACNMSQALNTNYLMARSYGVFGISAYFLPIINIIIVLTAIIGLSGLLGGDTSLAGLSRLV